MSVVHPRLMASADVLDTPRAGRIETEGALARFGPRAEPALWLLGAVTALGVALRFTALGSQSFWLDEWLTWTYMQVGVHGMLRDVLANQALPPLYFCVAWVWTHVFGSSEVGLRSLSALVGSATVPLVYAAARPRLSHPAALLAALIVAVNPFAVWYSQEARPYELLAALCAASLLGFVRVLDGGRGRWLWLWSISSALALTTHFFAFFFVGPEVLWLLYRRRERALVWPLVVVAVAGAAMIPLAARGAGSEVAWVHATAPLTTRLSWAPVQFLAVPNGAAWNVTLDVGVRFVVAAALCAGGLLLALIPAEKRRAVAPFAILGAAMIALPAALGAVKPSSDYFLPRYVIAAMVPLVVVIAAGYSTRRLRAIGALAGAVLVGVLLSMTISIAARPQLQRVDWKTTGHLVGSAPAPRAVITAAWVQSWPLTRYTPKLGPIYFSRDATWGTAANLRRPLTIRQLVLVGYLWEPQFWLPGRGIPGTAFREVRQAAANGFAVRVYSSPRPMTTNSAQLVGIAKRVYRVPWTFWTDPAVFFQETR